LFVYLVQIAKNQEKLFTKAFEKGVGAVAEWDARTKALIEVQVSVLYSKHREVSMVFR
jgi:hypothetical protein